MTLAASGSDEIIIQKSRFLGYASPCASEEEALAFLREIREEHRNATHHCYAYLIGENAGITRYSDNGEPAGTAGLPILDVLKSRNLVNCCCVVVRYFGGTLLGTGGLVRAYTQSAQNAVFKAGPALMEWTQNLLCEVPYGAWDKVRYAAEKMPVRIQDVGYGAAVSFHLLVREHDLLHALGDRRGTRLTHGSPDALLSRLNTLMIKPHTSVIPAGTRSASKRRSDPAEPGFRRRNRHEQQLVSARKTDL